MNLSATSAKHRVSRLVHGPKAGASPPKPRWHGAWNSVLAIGALILFAIGLSKHSTWLCVTSASAAVLFMGCSMLAALSVSFYDRGRETAEFAETFSSSSGVILDPLSRDILVAAAVKPDSLYVRVKESVSQLSRAHAVHTKYTIRVPEVEDAEGDNGDGLSDVVYVPVILARKGVLHDDLAITIAGQEVPTLSFEDLVRAIDAVFLDLAFGGIEKRKHFKRYLRTHKELMAVVGARRNENLSSSPEPESDAARRLADAEVALEGLKSIKMDQVFRSYIEVMTLLLSTNYWIIAAVPRQLCAPSAWLVIETTERAIMKEKDFDVARKRSSKIYSQVRASAQHLYGIPPNRLEYPVGKALRCASYHLEIMGSQGTYLWRQQMISAGYNLRYQRVRARRGQRYLHLYLRGFSPLGDRMLPGDGHREPRVICHFAERMPGSYAPAAISTVATLIVLFIASRLPPNTGVDVMALLIAAPGAFIGVSGFQSLQVPTVGASVLPRLAATATVFVGALGLLQFLLARRGSAIWSPDSHSAYVMTWRILVSLAAINAIFVIFIWARSALVHLSFVDDRVGSWFHPSSRHG